MTSSTADGASESGGIQTKPIRRGCSSVSTTPIVRGEPLGVGLGDRAAGRQVEVDRAEPLREQVGIGDRVPERVGRDREPLGPFDSNDVFHRFSHAAMITATRNSMVARRGRAD